MPSQKAQERMVPEDQLRWQTRRALTFAGVKYEPHQIIDPEACVAYPRALRALESTGKASRILPQIVVAPDLPPPDAVVPGRGVKAHREAARLNREASNQAERDAARATALEEAEVRLVNAHRANRARKRPKASEPDPLPPTEEVDDAADDDDGEKVATDPVVVAAQTSKEGQTDANQEQAEGTGSPGAGGGGAGQAGGSAPDAG